MLQHNTSTATLTYSSWSSHVSMPCFSRCETIVDTRGLNVSGVPSLNDTLVYANIPHASRSEVKDFMVERSLIKSNC